MILWVEKDILPSLIYYADYESSDTQYFIRVVLGLCGDLSNRVISYEEASKHPFDSLVAAEMAFKVLKRMVDNFVQGVSSSYQMVLTQFEKAENLLISVKIQHYFWNVLNERIRLVEVLELGLPGLLSEQLLSLDEEEIIQTARDKFYPMVEAFGFDFDTILEDLMEKVLTEHIVVSDKGIYIYIYNEILYSILFINVLNCVYTSQNWPNVLMITTIVLL